MRDQNLYELLQVSENADQEIIQAAYRRLVLRYHPDRSSEPNAAEMTQRLNDAYAILSDPTRRADYDRGITGRPGSSTSGADQTSSRTSRSKPNPPPPPSRPPPPTWSSKPDEGYIAGFPRRLLLGGIGIVAILVVGIVVAISVTASDSEAELNFNEGGDLVRQGNYKSAILAFDKVIQIDPDFPKAYAARALSYRHLEQYQKAVNDYDKAIQLDPDDAVAYSGRGLSHHLLGRYQRAIADYTRAIQLDPDDAVVYFGRAISYQSLGQYGLSDADETKACSLDSRTC